MEQILEKYSDTLTYRIYDPHFDVPIKEQVEMFANTRLLIGGHGAGMVNMVLLPEHAVVLEIFPYGIFMDAYQRMAATSGIIYMQIFSNDPGDRLSYCFTDCSKISDIG